MFAPFCHCIRFWIFGCCIAANLDFISAQEISDARDALTVYSVYGCEDQELYLRCPFSTYLNVISATYGRSRPATAICPYHHLDKYQSYRPADENTNCASPRSFEVVSQLCQERRACRLRATTRNFYPDPCPSTGKYLEVKYQCIPFSKLTDTACEGQLLRLACDKGKRLYITNAQYGWDEMIPQSCTRPSNMEVQQNSGCLSSIASSKTGSLCHGKRACGIEASSVNFEEFCPNLDKYLKVSFVCVPKKMLRQSEDGVPGSLSIEGEEREIFGVNAKDRNRAGYVLTSVSPSHLSPNPQTRSLILSNGEGGKLGAVLDPSCTNCSRIIPSDHPHSDNEADLVFGWVHSISYLQENQEKVILYGMLCGCVAFILALMFFIVRMLYVRRIKKRRQARQKLNITDTGIQDTSNEENTYVAAGDPSDIAILQYNLPFSREPTNRLNSGPGSFRGSHTTASHHRYHIEPEPNRFNTNSLTVSNNPLAATEHRINLNSPHTTASTAMNNSPNTAVSDQRNTFYENSADDEHTNDGNDGLPVARSTSSKLYNRSAEISPRSDPSRDVRPRTNSLFDRHS